MYFHKTTLPFLPAILNCISLDAAKRLGSQSPAFKFISTPAKQQRFNNSHSPKPHLLIPSHSLPTRTKTPAAIKTRFPLKRNYAATAVTVVVVVTHS